MQKYEVRILPQAYEELTAIFQYYINTFADEKLAIKITNLIIKNIKNLNYSPQKFQTVHTKYFPNDIIHALYVKKYCILYKIVEKSHQVFILKICLITTDWKDN